MTIPPVGRRRLSVPGHEDDVSDDEEEMPPLPPIIPPDGGWGWCIVVGSGLVNLIVFGMFRAGGIVLLACVEAFDTSRTIATWVPLLCNGLCYFLAPISGMLLRRFSYRQVVFLGGVVSSIGLLICYFAETIGQVFLGYGIVLGLGFGLALNPNLAIVGLYFEKRRALATGLSFSGGALGTFFLGPLLGVLVQRYGLRGSFLVLAAIVLHICVAATFFRPIEHYRKRRRVSVSSTPLRLEETEDEKQSEEPPKEGNVRHSILLRFGSDCDIEAVLVAVDQSPPPLDNKEFHDSTLANGVVTPDLNENITASHDCNGNPQPLLQPSRPICFGSPFRRAPSTTSRRKRALPRIVVTTAEGEIRSPSLPDSPHNSHTPGGSSCAESMPCDGVVLTNELFFLVTMGYSILLAAYLGMVIILPDFTEQEVEGHSRLKGATCISAAATGDLIGRLLLGWFVDKLLDKKRYLYQAGLSFMGILLGCLPFISNYVGLLAICSIIGFLYGVCLIHHPPFLIEYIGVEKYPVALGFMLAFSGVPTLGLGPVVGLIRDKTGSYSGSFFTLAAMVLGVAALWIFEPILFERQEKKKREAEEEEEEEVHV